MEWLKQGLSGGNDGDSNLMEAFLQGEAEALRIMGELIERGDDFAKKEQHLEATAMMFTAIHRLVGMAKVGVDKSRKDYGKTSPVYHLWRLLEGTLQKGNMEDALTAIREWDVDDE